MSNGGQWMQWYYLIYLLPGGIAFLVLLLSALSGGGRHHHSSSPSPAHAAGHQGHAHQGRVAHRGHHASVKIGPLLAFFGLGRVPAPLVWGSALLGWGLFGFWGTQLWQSALHRPALFALPALMTALAGMVVTEKATVEAAARLLPREESKALGVVDLCGLTGTVVFPIDAARGRVHVYDPFGTLHDVAARAAAGDAPLKRGQRVLVVDYDAGRDQVIVEGVPG